TVRSCARIALGLTPTGVCSAGDGAAMRAAVVGVAFHDRPERRASFGRALAGVTHRDERAVQGALYVAEVAACCVRGAPGADREACQAEARGVVRQQELGRGIDRARGMALAGAGTAEAAECGTSGYVVHAVSFA